MHLAAAGVLISEVLGVNEDTGIGRTESGKPYILEAENRSVDADGRVRHFSLAHGGDLAVIAVSDAPCGVDVERIKPYPSKVAERCLCDAEKELLVRCGGDETFFAMWCLKEAVLKSDGRGITEELSGIDVSAVLSAGGRSGSCGSGRVLGRGHIPEECCGIPGGIYAAAMIADGHAFAVAGSPDLDAEIHFL